MAVLLLYGMGKQPSGWRVLEHSAVRYARVYWIRGGRTRYRSGEGTMELKQNHVYIFPTLSPYEMDTDPDDPLDCLFLHLDLPSGNLRRPVCINPDREFSHLLRALEDGILLDRSSTYLDLLARSFEALCIEKGLLKKPSENALRWMALIRRTYRTDLSIRALAADLGYTQEAFIRAFQKQVGITPHRYAISLRMNDAVQLLAGGSSLDEIAHQVGYSDGHSFAGAFRRYYGVSPADYRRLYAGYV